MNRFKYKGNERYLGLIGNKEKKMAQDWNRYLVNIILSCAVNHFLLTWKSVFEIHHILKINSFS
jgi:hypothetical protein